MKKLLLDVGCGNSPKGDVNCDLFIGKTPHLMGKNNYINPKKIPNFVLCKAEYLPFRDRSFDIVNASELLEHVINPSSLLAEMKRVSGDTVTLDVPNLRRFFPEENPTHVYTWSSISLANLLRLFFKEVTIVSSDYGKYIPQKLLEARFIGFFFRFLESLMEKLLGISFLKVVCKV